MKIGHEMILASAGSGKTYALTNRFVRLLALGAKPERIVALTFTRKAAGEFFDEILKKLARAAGDAAAASRLAGEIAVPGFDAAGCLGLLRTMVESMPRLKLGTFDGFFARIAKNFPLELGLAGEFEMLEEHAAQMEHRRVMHRMFARHGPVSKEQKEFIEAFKQATFGVEAKRPAEQLARFIAEHQETYLEAPDGERWGNPARIWPGGCAWFEAIRRRDQAVKVLQAELEQAGLNDGQRARWAKFFADLAVWTPGVPMGDGLSYLFGNALKAWPKLDVVVVDKKKLSLPPAAVPALRTVVQAVIGAELARRLAMTQGIHAVISSYEAIYHETVRRGGRLTFADVQRLLQPGNPGTRMLSGACNDERRLAIDYRLDAQTDHWLLDEFQDTSFGQWSVLKNLIDEAVQDPTGARSFFYVGDVKQSIYAWRDGDPRLFREIYDHYNRTVPGSISEGHLDKSFRSGPAVIAMVNAVFGAAAVMRELFPGEASAEWNREWRGHVSAKPALGGQAALLHAEDAPGKFEVTRQLLEEIDPLARGLTVAVLVQKNDTAAGLADYLRREGGWPAVAEADLQVCTDNPLGATLLALVKAAAHPGDTLAWAHVRISPLGAVLTAAGITHPEMLTLRLLALIYARGFEPALHRWWCELEKMLDPADAFTRLRARQFLAAAGEFDRTGSRHAAEFIDFMNRYTVREPDAAAVIRVMTVHKAKGLGFDLVILPDLEGQTLVQARDGLAVQRDAEHQVEWVLDTPNKEMVLCDPVLSAQREAAEQSACYEKLSLLYVAMTRAKRALYVIIKPPGKSRSANFPRLLSETLGVEPATVRVGGLQFAGSFAEGDGDWHRPLQAAEGPATGVAPRWWLDPRGVQRSHRLPARRPSDGGARRLTAAELFAGQAGGDAAELGRKVHALLAGVEWWPETGMDAGRWSWTVHGEAGRLALACVRSPALAEVWRRREQTRLWRERAFEVVFDGVWLSGVFDRVVITAAPSGRPASACVYDFKTDEAVQRAGERHARQMNLYRRAAAQLLGLSPGAVTCRLVLVRTQSCIDIPLPADCG